MNFSFLFTPEASELPGLRIGQGTCRERWWASQHEGTKKRSDIFVPFVANGCEENQTRYVIFGPNPVSAASRLLASYAIVHVDYAGAETARLEEFEIPS
jgi:hypothetical protein